ncbi:hypothetical protein [Acidihalobacter ferrooxydans]|uniref:Uncharacterized protein n=1 Tax=Acidihalobacter ferrooxydans TaxID=1765967 RepID=A0A1P8UF80_9GAMM|nr:hypothetical protein [Acidihalobacter ferrooxydans]APZ42512.1 hypothetical protein BW247_04915 [Acidihalobacter ferrooxydans]
MAEVVVLSIMLGMTLLAVVKAVFSQHKTWIDHILWIMAGMVFPPAMLYYVIVHMRKKRSAKDDLSTDQVEQWEAESDPVDASEKKTSESNPQPTITAEKPKPRIFNTKTGLKNPFSPEKGFSGDYLALMRERYKTSHREALHGLVGKVAAGQPVRFVGPWAEEAAHVLRGLTKIPVPKNNVVPFNLGRDETPKSHAPENIADEGEKSWLNPEPPEGVDEYFNQNQQ